MRHLVPLRMVSLLAASAALACGACGGAQRPGGASPAAAAPASAEGPAATSATTTPAAPEAEAPGKNRFALQATESGDARGSQPPASKLRGSKTEAALKFVVIDKDKGPVPGVVVALTAPDGTKHYTEETDAQGFAEVLVPIGQRYALTYLSLGRQDIAASVDVNRDPNQNIKLTLRYKRYVPPPPAVGVPPSESRFILSGITFDTGKPTIRPESFPRLDSVVEYMSRKKSARIEISGHTDNVGNAKANQKLSEKRAEACRAYLISKGIDGSRIQAVGHGDQHPVASNATEEGRQQNRRIEAIEL